MVPAWTVGTAECSTAPKKRVAELNENCALPAKKTQPGRRRGERELRAPGTPPATWGHGPRVARAPRLSGGEQVGGGSSCFVTSTPLVCMCVVSFLCVDFECVQEPVSAALFIGATSAQLRSRSGGSLRTAPGECWGEVWRRAVGRVILRLVWVVSVCSYSGCHPAVPSAGSPWVMCVCE